MLSCLLVICPQTVDAQRQRFVDSLHNALAGQTGAQRFSALYDLAFEYVHKDNEKALKYIEDAGKAALLSGNKLWIVKSTRVRGAILYAMGNPQDAISVLSELSQGSDLRNFDSEYFQVMNTMGVSYLFTSRFDKALEMLFKAYLKAKETGDRTSMSMALANIGLVYYKLKNYDRAAHYLKRSIDASTDFEVSINLNASLCYAYLNDLDKARGALNRVVNECERDCSDVYEKHIKFAEAHILLREGRVLQAELGFLESLRLATQQEDVRLQLDNLYMLAKTSGQRNQLLKAEMFLEQAEKIIESGTPFNMEKVKVYEQLSSLHLSANNFKKAAFYQSAYIRLKDSIYNESLMTSLMEVESRHLQLENEAKIAEQQSVIALNQEVINRQNQLNVMSLILAGLTAVIIVILVRNYRKKQMLNILLEQRVKERTSELESNRHKLLERSRHQDLLLRRTFSGACGRLATVKGLCLTAREEVSDPVARAYVDKIDFASLKVDQILRSGLRSFDSTNELSYNERNEL